ncbi:hypothetical protein DUNSADRAFT_3299 [Dunaliella salina]|uniref:Encoded protein n=1 Tax=Dunaliella salina TaxID=3046 RepID=A0ABQ7GUA7_DUNSA|nr:hypothetical protein DUNSADRAFT_3299 [Dunaliella salina]|eukprot:KAF5838174.1 hypothetical protein DUNSADRAFT_3299 [Dunaliella salina]
MLHLGSTGADNLFWGELPLPQSFTFSSSFLTKCQRKISWRQGVQKSMSSHQKREDETGAGRWIEVDSLFSIPLEVGKNVIEQKPLFLHEALDRFCSISFSMP